MVLGKKISRKILLGLVIVSLVVVSVGGLSFAASKGNPNKSITGFVGGCWGSFGGAINDLAKVLGLKPEDIIKKRSSGKSLADIAKEQGVDENKVIDTLLSQREKLLDEKVKAGYITEDQKRQILEGMRARLESQIKNSSIGPGSIGPGNGGCFGRGGLGGGPYGGACGGPGGWRNSSWGGSLNVPSKNLGTSI
ncbi:MAG: hypothetical protein QME63_04045 [Actinomycetota bacterium]|nr:hypothetical protein [Actinomycetota bacterium]